MIENVREYFKKFGIENKILEFDVSSATVQLAAKALNTAEGRIAKSMAFIQGENVAIIVMTGDVKIDNAKYKAEFHLKAKMVEYGLVGEVVGHNAGGVCPFAINDGISVYLDNSLKKYDTVFPACGSSNSAIELTALELEKYSEYFKGWIDVTKSITE
jgi:prolyl-tRNA editing enzyme YbaK/EbsC (Cys-tRNA(Pro) deacylase)